MTNLNWIQGKHEGENQSFVKAMQTLAATLFLLILFSSCSKPEKSKSDKGKVHSFYPITPISFTKVNLTDDFWTSKMDTNREVTIPYGLHKIKQKGRIRDFERAAGKLNGEYESKEPFDDTDVYKIIEAASYSLQNNYNKRLDNYLDDIIAKIAVAQKKDGYLTTWKEIDSTKAPAQWVDPGPRWHDLGSSHELYNAGHLYEAAYAHYQATGKRSLLNIALKNADFICKVFGPDKRTTPPGHEIIEKGLVKLYRATGDKKYLNQAKFFLDERGDSSGHKLYGSYSQDQKPVVQQDEAVGHAVRAEYLYVGMTDIAAIKHDSLYTHAIDQIWNNVVSKKIYITGGVGALHDGEAFGDNYQLPNLTAYNETCAAVGNIYWNHRMFLLHGDAKYMDVLERTLYNGLISGVSLKGDTFFYPNPLESNGKYKFNRGALTRQSWFRTSCCPTNIMRLIPSIPRYIYGVDDSTVYVNLFIDSKADVQLPHGQKVEMEQDTKYPWQGNIKLTVNPNQASKFAVKVRIPGWARNEPIPSNLYFYAQKDTSSYALSLNGKQVHTPIKNGYVTINRRWKPGDALNLSLPMDVHRIQANSKVKSDRGKIALQRGPFVYSAEGVDNKANVLKVRVPDSTSFKLAYQKNLLGGVTTLKGKVLDQDGNSTTLTAIPYFAWSNRGKGKMTVWLNED